MSAHGIITGGRPGLNPDVLEDDIRRLLRDGHITPVTLARWCDQIKAAQVELKKLHEAFELMMPHRTDGNCLGLDGWRSGALLGYGFQIQSTQHEFSGNIGKVADRSLRILQKMSDEKQASSQLSII